MRQRQNLSSATLLCVALLCACGPLMAAEARAMEPDGANSCPENTATGNEATDEVDPDVAAAPARRSQKAKPAANARSNGGSGSNRNATPRWHSFLPGMFR